MASSAYTPSEADRGGLSELLMTTAVEARTHEQMADGAAAQAAYYQEISERFARMAEEYSNPRVPENPLPHHGITAVIVAHGESHEEIEDVLKGVHVNWFHHYSEYGERDNAEWTSDAHIWFRRVDRDLTRDLYRAEVDRWIQTARAARSASDPKENNRG